MNEAAAVSILKEAEKLRKKAVLKRQRAYFKPFFHGKKVWAAKGAQYTADFAIAVDKQIKAYQRACIKAFNKKTLFHEREKVQKAKEYKTWEYLDERYNKVVVPDIRDTLVKLKDSFVSALQKSYEKYIKRGNIRDSAELVYKNLGMDFNFNQFDAATSKYLKEKSIRWSKEVAESTEKLIKHELVKGYEEGLGSYDIAENIRNATGFSFHRSEAIARTEVISSCNYTDYAASMGNPDITGHTWSATGDGRTRPTHSAANGQKRKKGEAFHVGGYKLLYPGDSSLGAPARELINCRCTLLAVFKGSDLTSSTVYDEKDAGTKEWLLRQKNDFQEEYWGGKLKKMLGDGDLLKLKDREKPLKEILKEIFPVKLKAEDIKRVSDISETAANEVIKKVNTTWLYGKLHKKEMSIALSTATGIKVCKDVFGQEKVISAEATNFKELLKYLDKAVDNSIALTHNHPDNSSPSLRDLIFMIIRNSVKSSFVINDSGTLYLVEKVGERIYNEKIIADEIIQLYGMRIKPLKKLLASNKISEQQYKQKVVMMEKELFNLLLRKYNVKYKEW